MDWNVPASAIDPLFQLWNDFRADPREDKLNLGIGIYADDEGKPFVPQSVQQAARKIQTDNFNYLSMQGDGKFLKSVTTMILGENKDAALQATCGGTNACEIFARWVAPLSDAKPILIGTPTWSNHFEVFKALPQETFSHLNQDYSANIESYQNAIKETPRGSILLLHGGLTHNPTGRNLSTEDVQTLFPILKEKDITLFIDYAYAGLGEGWDADNAWVRTCWKNVPNIAVGVSFSKNASLYRHRLGALMIKGQSEKNVQNIESQLQILIRQTISNPPAFGSEIMNTIFDQGRDQWLAEVDSMRLSLDNRREKLCQKLPEHYAHLIHSRGMFGLLGINEKQIQRLREDFGLYIPANGRINIAGMPVSRIDDVAKALTAIL